MRAGLLRATRFARPRAPSPAPPASTYLGRTISSYSQRLRNLEEEDIGQTDAVSYSARVDNGGERGVKGKGFKHGAKKGKVQETWWNSGSHGRSEPACHSAPGAGERR